MRALPLAQFATEAGVPKELVERLVGVGAIVRLPDGRYDSRDEQVASTAQAVIDAGIPFDALAWALTEGRFGLRSLGLIFSEPVARTERTYAELAAGLGDDAAHLPAVYAALGLPEPEPHDHSRIDEAELVVGYVRLWSLVDPTGAAHIRVARQIGDGTRRIAEGWLDVWDETALPDPTTQGARRSDPWPGRPTRRTRSRTHRSEWPSSGGGSSGSSTNGTSRHRCIPGFSARSKASSSRRAGCRIARSGRRRSPSSTCRATPR